MKRQYALVISLFMFISLSVQLSLFPCTVAVISGKATRDGRPLMWKNRDTSVLDNKIVYFHGKKYSFIALVNALSKKQESAWAGINTQGFAIMNSASNDLVIVKDGMAHNGSFMKRALEECADVSDFEKLLISTNNNRKVAANFGVIDSKGSACFFETSNSSFMKFDANDPRVAPQGYIIRTNYAFTSPIKNGGGGYIRFERASRLFQNAAAEGRITVKFILQQVARDLVNQKLNSYPLSKQKIYDPSLPVYINTNDTINRNSSASVALFHGVSSPKDTYLSTMWVLLGQPVCTVAVPLWANAAAVPPELSGPETVPMNDFSRAIASYLYPDKRGHMNQYLNISRLLN
ncbi:MAG: hypothetical protein U9Q97_00725, partial [Acidobacteriota bacterium]|nr:hypothetical protein [Acidobacteriota bacterium]